MKFAIDIIIALVSLSAVVFSITSYLRFSSGHLKTILGWLILTFALLEAYKITEIMSENGFDLLPGIGTYEFLFVAAVLAFVRTFVEIDMMSRELGFVEFEQHAVDFFEDNMGDAKVKN